MKLFVNRSGASAFVCPSCNQVSIVSITREDEGQFETEVECACGFQGKAFVNTRRWPRKMVRVRGFCVTADGNEHPIEVSSLSQSGIGFKILGETRHEIGDEIIVKLRLKDDVDVLITKEAKIRQIRNSFIGA